ncbi:hypothetical protein HYH02_012422 [Chlamydomonas schloesseri]|uniref:Uncharacterized protein n=1 Tax=Chlamydomonas schloesseri TaxID=2026947 RepID=A0A835W071_9CHLO|nr:hypothetical protein HYH02_012422 [Chlamydomonas schloesseri]|eukprot:KAG2434410.1 hypothetical protein HYH02_012422 [Chlamydomonas schloesseri]
MARLLKERRQAAQRQRKKLAAILKSQLVCSRGLTVGAGGASPVYVVVKELDVDDFEALLGPQLMCKAVVSPKQASLDLSAPEDQAALFGRPPHRDMRGALGSGCRLQLASLELCHFRESRTLVLSGVCALVRAL